MSHAAANVLGAALLLAGAAVAWFSTGHFPAEARMFPRLVIAILAVAAVLWLVRSARERSRTRTEEQPRGEGGLARLIPALALTLAYGASVGHAGYFLPTMVYVPLMSALLGGASWSLSAAVGAAYAGAAYLLFVVLFERPMPLY